MTDKVFKMILLFTPVFYYAGVDYYKAEVVFFRLASILLFAASLFDTRKREFNLKNLTAIFLGICFFSTVTHSYSERSLSAFINIFFGCMDIYILAVYIEDIKKCANWLLVGLGINALVFIGQKLGYSPFIDPKTLVGVRGTNDVVLGEGGGIIGNAPRFAAFIALTLPFVKRWYIIPAVILGVLLKEASVFVSIFIILVYETRGYSKVWLGVAFGSIIGLSLVSFYKPLFASLLVRVNIWKDIGSILAQHPFVGFGLGHFEIADYGMSSFLQWSYGVGVAGLGFIVICLKRVKWYLMPLVFLCIFEYPFEIPRLWPVIIFTIAYYAIEQKEELLWV